ncbi:hypothetical protein [Corynebacterium flavescens]|uniref:Uncharacterized protein n=1 Tax=Corynebacterium flavescens TaxID=28028 RepID=A0A1L7CNJ0_CORFL|nr:hypothetical protein [Corynebacterium flavescens]APT87391.1 hypothetical protein CFLV_09500 [Corynebacterium flavescens]KAA8720476.1 hypothetical protein F4V60_09260 [Corynebacterium flavescens]GEB97763.1 hypothetical protein CFL01nite_12580 [Corynebacterium flavescens]
MKFAIVKSNGQEGFTFENKHKEATHADIDGVGNLYLYTARNSTVAIYASGVWLSVSFGEQPTAEQ